MEVVTRPAVYSRLPAILAICGFILSSFAFWFSRTSEQRNAAHHFEVAARDRLAAVATAIHGDIEALQFLADHVNTSGEVSRQEFGTFTMLALGRHSTIQALNWVPRVPRADHAGVENTARMEGATDFRIMEKTAQGVLMPAGDREEYYPVLYREPAKGRAAVLGYDEASDPSHLSALSAAGAAGQTTGTGRVALLHPYGEQFGFLAYAPVYRMGAPRDSAAVGQSRIPRIESRYPHGDMRPPGSQSQAFPDQGSELRLGVSPK